MPLKSTMQHEPLVGVDIGPDYIRAVQLERNNGGFRLRNIGITPTPQGSVSGGLIVDPKKVGREIKKLFRERRFDTTRVATAARGKGVMSRIITLPSMPQNRLGRLIENEVNRYILFSEQDKVVYYYPLEEFDEYDRRKINILLVVAQKSWCRSYLDTFKEAGLNLVGIDYSTFAILRELRNSSNSFGGGTSMALALDYQGASLNIFHNDILRFTRQLRIDQEGPESLANGFKGKVLSELLISTQFYESIPLRGETVEKVIISLGASGADAVGKLIENSLQGIKVETHSPFSNIKVGVDEFPQDIMEKVDTNFLTAAGIAMREQEVTLLPFQIDLLPAEVLEKKLFKSHLKIFGYATLMVAMLCILAWQLISFNTTKIADKAQYMVKTQLEPQSMELQKLSVLNNKMKSLNPVNASVPVTADMSALTEEIKKVIPKTVQLNSLIYEEPGKIEFSGVAESNTSVFDFQTSLENSAMFNSIELGPRSPATIFGKPMVRFVIRCKYLKAAK